MRLRLTAQVVLGTLLVTALAGCSSAPAAEVPDGGLQSSYVDADNKTHGYVAGVVLSQAGEPVPGALVTILSVEGSATSDSAGEFEFTGVARGEQSLRVAKENYKTIQRPFTVVAGKVVELEVVLARADGLGGGAIEHFHDHWRGQEVYTIYEGRLELEEDVTQGPTVFIIASYEYYPIVPDEDRIVPPGTDKISIDISFEPSPMFDQEYWMFNIYPPPGPDGSLYAANTWVLANEDEHLEYDLPASEITDHGHASYTNWGFTLSIYNDPMRTWPGVYNMLFPRPIDITITAHKGDLAIDPPHAKYWANADRIEMSTGPETWVYCSVPGASPRLCDSRSPNPDVTFGGIEAQSTCDQGGCMVLERGGLVPPGTTRISFDVETWQASAAAGTEPAASDTDWVLGFKTAATPRGGATWDDYTWVEPVETFEPEPQQGRFHQKGLRYMIDVPAGGEDPYYTAFSGWIFMMAVQGYETASDWSDMSCSTSLCGSPFFELKNFFVHHDSPASDMETA